VLSGEKRVRNGLGFHTLTRIHDQQRPFASGERARNFVGKINVAWSINEVKLIFLSVGGAIVQANALGFDGDAALFFQIHGIEHLRRHLALAERTGKFQQSIGKRGLAMIDVRDDAKVADEAGIHEAAFISARSVMPLAHAGKQRALRTPQFDTIACERLGERIGSPEAGFFPAHKFILRHLRLP
jgi:hypothetical protein